MQTAVITSKQVMQLTTRHLTFIPHLTQFPSFVRTYRGPCRTHATPNPCSPTAPATPRHLKVKTSASPPAPPVLPPPAGSAPPPPPPLPAHAPRAWCVPAWTALARQHSPVAVQLPLAARLVASPAYPPPLRRSAVPPAPLAPAPSGVRPRRELEDRAAMTTTTMGKAGWLSKGSPGAARARAATGSCLGAQLHGRVWSYRTLATRGPPAAPLARRPERRSPPPHLLLGGLVASSLPSSSPVCSPRCLGPSPRSLHGPSPPPPMLASRHPRLRSGTLASASAAAQGLRRLRRLALPRLQRGQQLSSFPGRQGRRAARAATPQQGSPRPRLLRRATMACRLRWPAS